MDRVPLPDLNNLDRDALLALYQAQQEKLDAMIAGKMNNCGALKLNSMRIARHSPNKPMSCALAASGLST